MQKTIAILLSFLSLSLSISLSAKESYDTTVQYFDAQWKITSSQQAQYRGLLWKEGKIWHRKDYYIYPPMLQMDGQYLDADCKIKQGVITSYYTDGKMQDSGFYENNKREGLNKGWYDTGEPAYINHFLNNNMVDSSVAWHRNGTPSQIVVADNNGTGTLKEYFDDGKTRAEGNLYKGKRTGTWTFTDANKVVSQVVKYEMDGIMNITNFDENGNKIQGKAILEKAAEFPGGMNGWRRFLEANLRYPSKSQKKKVEGVVRMQMVVDKLGKVSDVKVLSAPDKYTGEEGERIIKLSPDWIPAVQYNRKVTYRFVQTITFALQ